MSEARELGVVEAAERLLSALGGHMPDSVAHEVATLEAAVEAYRLDEHYQDEALGEQGDAYVGEALAELEPSECELERAADDVGVPFHDRVDGMGGDADLG